VLVLPTYASYTVMAYGKSVVVRLGAPMCLSNDISSTHSDHSLALPTQRKTCEADAGEHFVSGTHL